MSTPAARTMAVLVLLVLAGCGATPAQREVGQQEMQRISDEMRSMDGVTEVESAYQTTIRGLRDRRDRAAWHCGGAAARRQRAVLPTLPAVS